MTGYFSDFFLKLEYVNEQSLSVTTATEISQTIITVWIEELFTADTNYNHVAGSENSDTFMAESWIPAPGTHSLTNLFVQLQLLCAGVVQRIPSEGVSELQGSASPTFHFTRCHTVLVVGFCASPTAADVSTLVLVRKVRII